MTEKKDTFPRIVFEHSTDYWRVRCESCGNDIHMIVVSEDDAAVQTVSFKGCDCRLSGGKLHRSNCKWENPPHIPREPF